MRDDRPLPETYQEQPVRRRRRLSLVVLPYWQRILIGMVIIVLLIIFGGLAVGIFARTP
jgi:hypothetical protein